MDKLNYDKLTYEDILQFSSETIKDIADGKYLSLFGADAILIAQAIIALGED